MGNKIEMEITDLVEKNSTLLRLGLHLEFNDARHRVAAHLQRNIDRSEYTFFLLIDFKYIYIDKMTFFWLSRRNYFKQNHTN